MNRPLPPRPSLLRALVTALALLVAVGAHADIIPPNRKSVDSKLLFEGMEKFPGMTFVLFPESMGEAKGVEVKKGKSVRFYRFVSPKLYALKAGTKLGDPAIFEDPTVPRSKLEIEQVGTVPLSEKASSIRRVYQITGIKGNEILLKRLPDQRFDAKGKPLDAPAPVDPKDTPKSPDKKKGLIGGAAGLFALVVVLFALGRGRRGSRSVADPEG